MKKLCTVLWTHFSTEQQDSKYVLWVQILVWCLANNKCANHRGRNHLHHHLFRVQPYQLIWRPTSAPRAFIDAALWARNFSLFLLCLPTSFFFFKTIHICSFSLKVFFLFLFPSSSPQAWLRCSAFPLSLPNSSCVYNSPWLTGLWLFVSYNGDQLPVTEKFAWHLGESQKIMYIHILNILFELKTERCMFIDPFFDIGRLCLFFPYSAD